MESLYPLFIAFLLIFVSELGDKTQLLVLSFSSKLKTCTILLGVAIGSFLSHGIAILFGSSLSLIANDSFGLLLEIATYVSFLIFGVFSFIPKKEKRDDANHSLLQKFCKLNIGYVLLIAISIATGELGDKTFLASIGLGIRIPSF